MTLAELLARRNKLAADMRSHADENFFKNGKKWRDGEARTKWDAINKDYNATMAQIDEARSTPDDVQTRLDEMTQFEERSVNDGDPIPGREDTEPKRGQRGKARGYEFRDVHTGRVVRSYSNEETITSDREELSIGRCLRSMLLGRVGDLTDKEQRAMLGGVDANGGYLLSPSLSTRVIDLARSSSVALRAGVQTLPMTTSEMQLARLASDPTSYWRPELVAVAGSGLTLERIALRARTLAAIVPVSIEMLEDSANIATVIENALRSSMGLKLDQAVLAGTGAGEEPKGIRNHADVQTVAAVGTPADYRHPAQAVSKILQANYNDDPSGLAWIQHPRSAQTYDGLLDTTDQPLQPTPWAAALQRFYTTSIATNEGGGANESYSIIGRFQEVLLGMRTSGVTIRVLDAGSVTDADASTFNAASQLGKLIVAYLRADVAVMRPTWFCNLTGILA